MEKSVKLFKKCLFFFEVAVQQKLFFVLFYWAMATPSLNHQTKTTSQENFS